MSKHKATLTAVFANPIKANIRWGDIETLLEHHGAEIVEGEGSRVHAALNGVRATFHRPHPSPDTDKGAVKSVRRFLEEAGVLP